MKVVFDKYLKHILLGGLFGLFFVGTGCAVMNYSKSLVNETNNIVQATAEKVSSDTVEASQDKTDVKAESVAKKPASKKELMIATFNEKLAEEFKIRNEYADKGYKSFKWASFVDSVVYIDGSVPGVKITLNAEGSKLKGAQLFAVTEHAHNFATGTFYTVGSTKHKAFTDAEFEKLFGMDNRQKEIYAVLADNNGKVLHKTGGPLHTFNAKKF